MRRISPIVLSLALVVMQTAAAIAQLDGYRTIEDEGFGLTSVVPADWQDRGFGSYTRGTPPADLAMIVIQSAPGTSDELWPALLPQLRLAQVPDASGELIREAGTWDLYREDVTVGSIDVAIEVALLETDDTTYLMLLQADPSEFEALREQVLLPAIEAFAPLGPQPSLEPPDAGYHSEDVVFPGGAAGVELAGTLTLPATGAPHPVVVLLSGSGPSDRDESIAPLSSFKPFADLAHALTAAGVGVLRYDDRGVGASSGDHAAADIDDFTADATAAIDYLATRDDVDAGRIGLFGHSEGGLYAAKLGASDDRVSSIGMMAPAVLDGVSLIVEQNVAVARTSGASEEQAAAAGDLAAKIMPLIVAGEFEAAERIGRDFYAELWDGLSADEQAVAGDRETFIEQGFDVQIPVFRSDWFRSLLGYDPATDWRQVTVPVLAVFGGKDSQVVAASNEAALVAALAAAGNDDVTTVTIPDANHLFQEAETGSFSEYGRLEPAYIDGFLDTVVGWFVDRIGAAE